MQQQLSHHQRRSAKKALEWIVRLPHFGALPGGLEYWGEVRDRLQAMHYYGTTDGEPWVEPVKPSKPQSVDSAGAGFVMPNDWHWRLVDAINGRNVSYEVRLIGWDPSGKAKQPYFVTDAHGDTLWAERIRFDDGDTCDWSDDDEVEPC